MIKKLTWLDHLRIERTVQTLDLYVQGLPGPARRAVRREIRTNLRAAALEQGATAAVRALGSLRLLAASYLEAEYGEGRPRPRWLRATAWVFTVELVLLAAMFSGHAAFVAGVEAAGPAPNTRYAWQGLSWLGVGGEVTYDERGQAAGFGFTLSAWLLVYLLVALILGGRLWRLPTAWWHARQRAPHPVPRP